MAPPGVLVDNLKQHGKLTVPRRHGNKDVRQILRRAGRAVSVGGSSLPARPEIPPPSETTPGGDRKVPAPKMTRSKPTVHSFTLFVEGLDVSSDAHLDALYEAGCDDATFGARDGAAYGIFDREGGSFSEALRGAIDAVLAALPEAQITRIEPDDLVTMATIARRCGRTRESIRLLANEDRGPGGFPPPVAYVDERTRLWHWPDVARWLNEHRKAKIEIDAGAADLVAALNAALDVRQHSRHLPPSDQALVSRMIQADRL
jgi:hypothetical protein